MGNRFQPLVKPDGMIHTAGGFIEPAERYFFNGFVLTADGVLTVRWAADVVEYFYAGLPFTSLGQLVITGGTPLYYDQGVGFGEEGRVHLSINGALPVRYDQGVGFIAGGSIAGVQVAVNLPA